MATPYRRSSPRAIHAARRLRFGSRATCRALAPGFAGLSLVVLILAALPAMPARATEPEGETGPSAAAATTAGEARIPERLRHKDRAGAQQNQTDLDFTTRGARNARVPAHSPEWTNPKQGDPGMQKESGEKGGTADINIGVGELSAEEGSEAQRSGRPAGTGDRDRN